MNRQTHMGIHRYQSYGWLRGFNIIPSWGARIEQAWWDYDPARFREEVALAAQTHANCIRLWIEFPAWMADPDGVCGSFMDAVTAIGELGMKTMPCLFNRWHDRDYDYGGTYNEDLYRNIEPRLEYVRALVTPLAADERILAWDLCNEPATCRLDDPIAGREIHWLSRVPTLSGVPVRSSRSRSARTRAATTWRSSHRYATCCAATPTAARPNSWPK